MPEESDTSASIWLSSQEESWRKSEVGHRELQGSENGALDQTISDERELVHEEEVSPEDGERGQALQIAEVVMNMLDVTMPGTLTEEKKQKVLAAINQGDTLMKALQDAVPEDVRGKLTDAVSGVLHAQGSNIKFDQLFGINGIPDMSSGLKSKIQDKFMGISSSEGLHQDNADLLKKDDGVVDSSVNSLPDTAEPPQRLESEHHPTERSEKVLNLDQSHSWSSHESVVSGSVGTEISELGNGDNESSKEKTPEHFEISEKGSELDMNPKESSQIETVIGAEEKILEEAGDQDGRVAQLDTKEKDGNDNQKTDNKIEILGGPEKEILEEQRDQNGGVAQLDTKEKEANDTQKTDNKIVQPVMDESRTFNVSEALDALTGIDDNTQLAVNNVFGVIENMISQMEESSEHESAEKKVDSVPGSESGKDHLSYGNSQEDSEASDQSVEHDELSNTCVSDDRENGVDLQPDAPNGSVEKPKQSPMSVNGNCMNSDAANSAGQDKNEKKDQLVGFDHPVGNGKINHVKVPLAINSIPNGVPNYPISDEHTQLLDSDPSTSLLLDYFPEEGKWKRVEQPGHVRGSVGGVATHRDADTKIHNHSSVKVDDKIIEPSYVILDTEKVEYETVENLERVEIGEGQIEEFMQFVKNVILNTLKIEVGRRVSIADKKTMETCLTRDVEQVASAVSFSVGHDKKHSPCIDYSSEKVGTLDGELVIKAISSSVQHTSVLRKVLPVGVIVGSTLAALRKYFLVVAVHNYGPTEALILDQAKISAQLGRDSGTEIHHMPVDETDQNITFDTSVRRKVENTGLNSINNTVMVGAVTAALGASAFLVESQDSYKGDENPASLSESLVKGNGQNEPDKLEEAISENPQNNIVTSLTEKAMSVAAPVGLTREDGGLDQERLVAMLTELGQKGGMLRLVAKVALLWGGLRGAMSLTDKLIQFLHIAERPLIQRIFGFAGMVLVLWSPVVVPLLPTFLRSWATRTSPRIAELTCIVGLYAAFLILVTIWGKRIRGYDNPLLGYRLDLTSFPKLRDFFKGLIGGAILVLSIQAVNTLLGCVNLAWPSIPPSMDAMSRLKVYGQVLRLIGQGIITASGIAVVEELFFRSWLPQEIAADLGYHRGIVISGLAYALSQRSPWSIPGLWLLSLSLAGARQRNQGSLSTPIGLRVGILASSFILQMGGYVTYRANCPHWLMGTHPFQPFSGLTGFAFSLVLALLLYRTQQDLDTTIEEFKKPHAGG